MYLCLSHTHTMTCSIRWTVTKGAARGHQPLPFRAPCWWRGPQNSIPGGQVSPAWESCPLFFSGGCLTVPSGKRPPFTLFCGTTICSTICCSFVEVQGRKWGQGRDLYNERRSVLLSCFLWSPWNPRILKMELLSAASKLSSKTWDVATSPALPFLPSQSL
jgi:hypothetical protein